MFAQHQLRTHQFTQLQASVSSSKATNKRTKIFNNANSSPSSSSKPATAATTQTAPAKAESDTSSSSQQQQQNNNGRKIVNGQDVPSFEDISTAHFRIRTGVIRTRCVESHAMSKVTGSKIFLKHEWEQRTGSFKERGARNALLSLSEVQKKKGVVAASAGNHALALAYHGSKLGIPVTVIMPSIAPLTKIAKCRDLNARVILHGATIADAAKYGKEEYVAKEGLKYINGFDDFEIISGAGSMAIEILEDVKDCDAIVIPVGGAGLIAGCALAIKTLKPDCLVIGVEADRCQSMTAALANGKPTLVTSGATLADGLAVPTVGPRSFETCKDLIDVMVTVSEKEIATALLRLVELEKLVQEGAGATGLAAVLANKIPQLKGKTVAVALCGGNIDTSTLGYCIERGLVADGRLIKFEVVVSDRPGGIAGLCTHIADEGASIKHINHDRARLGEESHSVLVTVEAECTGPDMAKKLIQKLDKNYKIISTSML
jgi:threonine dehydratase